MTSPALLALPARAGRSLVTGALVLFAAWTLVYQVALLVGLPATPALLISVALGVGALVLGRRLAPGRPPLLDALPSGSGSVAVLVATAVGTGLALAGLRVAALALAVVVAAVALVLTARRPRVPESSPPSDAAAAHAEPESATSDATSPWLWPVAWLAAGVSGALASIVVRPDGDDAYFVNLSTWVAERGRFPLRDTMISPDLFPGARRALATDPLGRGPPRSRGPGARPRGRHRGLRADAAGRHGARGARAGPARRGGPRADGPGSPRRGRHLPVDDRRLGLQLRQLLRRADVAGQGHARLRRPPPRAAHRGAPRAVGHRAYPPPVRRGPRRRRRRVQLGRLPRAGARRGHRPRRARPAPPAGRPPTRRVARVPPRGGRRVGPARPRGPERGAAAGRGLRRLERGDPGRGPAPHRPGAARHPRRHVPRDRARRTRHPERRAPHGDGRRPRRGRDHPVARPA